MFNVLLGPYILTPTLNKYKNVAQNSFYKQKGKFQVDNLSFYNVFFIYKKKVSLAGSGGTGLQSQHVGG